MPLVSGNREARASLSSSVSFFFSSARVSARKPMPEIPDTDWFRDARYGVFVHFLPGDAEQLAQVDDFDVEALARQLESVGAGYLILTLGQNSGFFNAPNPTYDRITGYGPGERTSRRDLPRTFTVRWSPGASGSCSTSPARHPTRTGARRGRSGCRRARRTSRSTWSSPGKWAEVIQDWSVRYGDRVAGWWFDGGYEWVGFNEEIAGIYAEAARRGNPRSIVTFNPGIGLKRWTRAESYTAGELTEPFDVVPASRWLEGSQWHALTYLGSHWSRPRHAASLGIAGRSGSGRSPPGRAS